MNVKKLVIFLLFFSSISYGKNGVIAHLRNGDTLPGTIQGLNKGNQLSWNAPFFEKSINIPTNYISSLNFPNRSVNLPAGKKNYLVKTKHGNALHWHFPRSHFPVFPASRSNQFDQIRSFQSSASR